MAAEGIAQVLHVGRVGDLARLQRSARCTAGERRCGLGKHVLRLRVDFPRAVASIDAMPHRHIETCRLRAVQDANSGSRPIPPPHAGVESSACGASSSHASRPQWARLPDGPPRGRRRQRSQSPGLAERVIAKRRSAKPRPDVGIGSLSCQTALEQRLALLASLRLASWISCCSSCRPCGPLPASARGCRRCPATALATAARALARSAALAALARRVGRIGDRRGTRLAHPFLRSPSYCLSSLTLDPWSLAMAIPLDR